MILFIWVSIHSPHVDIDIIVNSIFIFNGKFVIRRFSKDEVISNILSNDVFIRGLFIVCIGKVLKNIIVPKIVIRVDILFLILVIIVLVILILL
jgi:hypothetical protein